jgi:hypothetical protein
MDLCHSCTRPPCHPIRQNGRINKSITTSMPPPYAKMDGLIPFLHVTAMPPHTPKWMDLYHCCTRPPCHPYAKMDGPIRTSLAPCHTIRQNGWTYTILVPDRQATPNAKMDGPIKTLLSPCHPIRQNGWTYIVLVRAHFVTHTPKWTDQSEHHYLHATHMPKWMDLCHCCM